MSEIQIPLDEVEEAMSQGEHVIVSTPYGSPAEEDDEDEGHVLISYFTPVEKIIFHDHIIFLGTVSTDKNPNQVWTLTFNADGVPRTLMKIA